MPLAKTRLVSDWTDGPDSADGSSWHWARIAGRTSPPDRRVDVFEKAEAQGVVDAEEGTNDQVGELLFGQPSIAGGRHPVESDQSASIASSFS